MKIIVGTKNASKIAIVRRLAGSFIVNGGDVSGVEAPSGVPETPWDDQTRQGAINRAKFVQRSYGADYNIGIESGLVDRYGTWFEEAWACIYYGSGVVYGYSSGLVIPDYVKRRMQDIDHHGPTMKQIREELGITDNKDTWGTYSGNLILRDVSLEEALRNAFIQLKPAANSLYHLS